MQMEISRYYSYVDRPLDNQRERWTQGENAPSKVNQQQSAGEAMAERLKEKEAYVQRLGITGKRMKEENEKLKNLLTCLEISRRITAGDKVPQADHQFLQKYDPALYARSIAMRFPKNNPYQYKRLSKDDECKNECPINAAAGVENLKPIDREPSVQEISDAVLDIRA